MIINITISQLFTVDPAIRFSKEYGLPQDVWPEIWRRYKLLDYTRSDLHDYIFIKYARNLDNKAMRRWIERAEIYSITKPLVKMGVQHVNSSIFGDYEEYIMNELVKRIKDGGTSDSKSIL